MPRSARIEFEGAIHHVTMRGNRGTAIFLDDADRKWFLSELNRTADDYRWRWLSYCLMGNHTHLVIETPERTLGLGMRRLAGRHAWLFNRRHETYGHLFQGRYGSVVVKGDAQFGQLLRYVALNPVKAALCADPAAWPWSSHRALLSGGDARSRAAAARVEELLEWLGGTSGTRYARLFEAGEGLSAQISEPSPGAMRPPLGELLAAFGRDDGIRAAREHGYRLREIAAVVGLHESTISRRTRAS